MSSNVPLAPQWLTDLNFPPTFKSKSGSILDPPGYPSQSGALSKVGLPLLVTRDSFFTYVASYRNKPPKKPKYNPESNLRPKRWIL